MRILVIGRPAAGKTTFAKKIAGILDIPSISMDDIYWKDGWRRPDQKQFLADLNDILKSKSWVLDGNYLNTLPERIKYCDYVIYLDYATGICLARFFKRTVKRLFKADKNLPKNIKYPYKKTVKFGFFVKKILLFNFLYKKDMLSILKDLDKDKVFIISSHAQDSIYNTALHRILKP